MKYFVQYDAFGDGNWRNAKTRSGNGGWMTTGKPFSLLNEKSATGLEQLIKETAKEFNWVGCKTRVEEQEAGVDKKPTSVQVVKLVGEKTEETVEILVESIRIVSEAMKKISESRLYRHALVTLIKEQTRISSRDINAVLDCLYDMEKTFLKPK